jgi:hypothetical protein
MTTFPHVKLTAFGTLGSAGGNEIWSCGIKVGIAAAGALGTLLAPTLADVTAVATMGEASWRSFITGVTPGAGTTTVAQYFMNEVAIEGAKAAAVGTDEKDDPAIDSVIFDSPGTGNRGLAAGGKLPYTVSLAATFRGATFKRGAAAFGRIYLPLPNLFIGEHNTGQGTAMSDGLVGGIVPPLFSAGVGHLLDLINSTPLTGGRVAMVCNISTSQAAAGVRFQNVNQVTVDNRPDTVRRRSNKLGSRAVSIQLLPVA